MTKPVTITDILRDSINPRMWTIGVGSVMTGCGAAALQANFEPIAASLCFLFVIAAQVTGNFAHNYYDEKYGFGDTLDQYIHTYRDLAYKPEAVFREAMIAGLIVCGMLGLTIAAMAGWWVLILGGVIALAVALDFCIPSPLVRTPWGIVVTFLLFGPIGVIGTSLAQSQHEAVGSIFSWHDLGPAVYLSVVAGVMACNCHLAHSYASFQKDSDNSKNTLTVRYGQAPTRTLFLINMLLMVGVMLALFLVYHPTRWGVTFIGSLCCLPGYVYVWRRMTRVRDSHQWSNLIKITCYSMLVLSIVVFVAFLITGRHETSHLQYFIDL